MGKKIKHSSKGKTLENQRHGSLCHWGQLNISNISMFQLIACDARDYNMQ